MGRIVAVGLTSEDLPVGPYADLIVGERTLVGCSDHLATEIPELFALAASGDLVFDEIVTNEIPLRADSINAVLDGMQALDSPVRTVIVPG